MRDGRTGIPNTANEGEKWDEDKVEECKTKGIPNRTEDNASMRKERTRKQHQKEDCQNEDCQNEDCQNEDDHITTALHRISCWRSRMCLSSDP